MPKDQASLKYGHALGKIKEFYNLEPLFSEFWHGILNFLVVSTVLDHINMFMLHVYQKLTDGNIGQ